MGYVCRKRVSMMKMARNITNNIILYAGEASQNGSNKVERNTQTAAQKAQGKEQRIQKKEAAKSLKWQEEAQIAECGAEADRCTCRFHRIFFEKAPWGKSSKSGR